jgi:hypothetical protein
MSMSIGDFADMSKAIDTILYELSPRGGNLDSMIIALDNAAHADDKHLLDLINAFDVLKNMARKLNSTIVLADMKENECLEIQKK